MLRFRGISIFLIMLLLIPASVEGQPLTRASRNPTNSDICVSDYVRNKARSPNRLGISDSDAEILTRQIVANLGSTNHPQTIACGYIDQAEAFVAEDREDWPGENVHVPAGEYILYNPVWTRQVIGSDRAQAIVLFGHEVGHLINRDFTGARKSVPQLTREREADRFAGCAAARMGLQFNQVSDLLSRLREENDSDHPSRLSSLEAARAGYNGCLTGARPSLGEGGAGPRPLSQGVALSLSNAKRLEEAGRLSDARRAYEPVCNAGSGEACRLLGTMQQDGRGGGGDYVSALANYHRGCEAGDALACYGEGQIYEGGGPGVAADPAKSRLLYRNSCEAGASLYNAVGCFGLGTLEAKGIGGESDIIDARERFEKSCKIGFAVGCHSLSIMYRGGLGGDLDVAKADGFLRKACVTGYKPACS
jgi:TPR repeat protein